MAYRVNHHESLTPLGLLPIVLSDVFGKAGRSDSLTVDDGRGGMALPAVLIPGVGPKSIMDSRQGSIPSPGPGHMEDRFEGRKNLGQQGPVTTRLGDIQQSVHVGSKGSSWLTHFSWGGQHRFEKDPLSVGKVGGIIFLLNRLEIRCRGDVVLSGPVPSPCLCLDSCWFPQNYHENRSFDSSDGI